MREPIWVPIAERLPDIGAVVETKIHDEKGKRNVQPLKRGGSNGRLWFFADDSMYVYYVPTHWRNRLHAEQPKVGPS